MAMLALSTRASATEVGAIGGSFTATPSGQAIYAIPLAAPGGAGGLAPHLAIVYASGSGPGLLGWDVTLSGLSIINRCAASWPYDGQSTPVSLTNEDSFCLNGSPLTLKVGSNGHDGALYTPTPSRHLYVVAHTSNNAIGPEWFDVHRQDGSVWEYGRYNQSRVSADNGTTTVYRLWALNKITDGHGNIITFDYTQPTGTGAYYLSEVDWGANSTAGTSATHRFVIDYTTVSADQAYHRYLLGNLIVRDQRIAKITLQHNSIDVLSWTPSYTSAASTGHIRFNGLTECAGTHCLPATALTWQTGTAGFAAAQNSGQVGPSGADVLVADINGDGREDLIYARASQWRVRFGQAAGGFGSEYATNRSATQHPDWAQPIHFQPGAADQVLYVDTQGKWDILSWNGSTFITTNTSITATSDAAAADVDGDGYDDLVTHNSYQIFVRFNQARTQSPGFAAVQMVRSYTYGRDTVLKFRAVGQQGARGAERALSFRHHRAGVIAKIHHHEVICIRDGCPPGSRKIIIDRTYNDALIWDGANFDKYGQLADGEVIVLDANADGLSDVFLASQARLYLNTDEGFTTVNYAYGTSGLLLDRAVALDYNNDGCDDILVPSSSGNWMLLASTGSALGAPVNSGIASGAFGTHPLVADTQGRMLADLVGRNGSGNIELALHHNAHPNLLASLSNGFGIDHALTWAPLSDTSTVQSNLPTDEIFELARRGRFVLASVTASDGIGGDYTLSYAYDSPVLRAGVGFAGMNSFTLTDSRSQNTLTREFDYDQFKNGAPKATTLAQSNGNPIRTTTWDIAPLSEGSPLEVNQQTTTYYDQSGTALYTVVRANTYDNHGQVNYSKVTTTQGADQWVQEVTQDPTGGTYTQVCGGLVTYKTVKVTLPSGASKTRKTTFTQDYPHCRYTGMTSNANLATALQTTTALSYDSFGNLQQITVTGHKADGSAMAARITQYAYDSHGEFLTSVTDPLGQVTGFTWEEALGLKASQTAPNGNTTGYSYDALGRLTQTTLPSGAYKTLDYAICTQWCSRWSYYVQMRIYDSGGAQVGFHRRYVDRYGRGYEDASILGGKWWVQSVMYYNDLGQVVQQNAPYFSGDTRYWTNYSYDALGRPTQIQAPTASGSTATTQYAYNGLATTVTDPAGHVTQITKNPLGQVVAIVDAAGNTTSYQYAPFGQVTMVTGPDNEISTVLYNDAGYRTSLQAPDLGPTTIAATTTFETNSLGTVTKKTDGSGHTTTYSYDKLGRMISQQYPGSGGEDRTWSYATSGNAAGRLVSATRAGGYSQSLSYNALGQPTTVTQTLGGQAWSMHYGYDSLGRVDSMTYPATAASQKLQLTYAYNASGQLASITDAHSATVYWQLGSGADAMSAWGAAQKWTLGNGVEVERSLSAKTGQITSIMAGPNYNASRVSLAYGYDVRGNTHTTLNVLTGVGRTLSYDDLSRLTTNVVANASGNHTRSTGYGAGGNITHRSGVGTYSYTGGEPHAVTQTTLGGTATNYVYNGLGQMASSSQFSQIAWTRGGRVKQLTGATTTSLDYGANGSLVTKSVAGTTSRYFGKLFVKIGNTWRERIVANGEVIAIVNVNVAGVATTDYLVHDAQGSPTAMLDASGNLVARFAWNAWGELVDPNDGINPDPNANTKHGLTTIGYTGHEMLWEAGLVHTYARVYNAHLGRWLSPDPTVPNLYNGQSLNRFSYVLNNPLTYVDPLGYEYIIVVYGERVPCPSGMAGVFTPDCYWNFAPLVADGPNRGNAGRSGATGPRVDNEKEENPCGSEASSTQRGINPFFTFPDGTIAIYMLIGAGATAITGGAGYAVVRGRQTKKALEEAGAAAFLPEAALALDLPAEIGVFAVISAVPGEFTGLGAYAIHLLWDHLTSPDKKHSQSTLPQENCGGSK